MNTPPTEIEKFYFHVTMILMGLAVTILTLVMKG